VKIPEKEIDVSEMCLLVKKGIILEFQIFLGDTENKKQVYRTKVASGGVLYVCYHCTPFPFMITKKGQIID